MLPAGSIVRALYHKLLTQSSAPEDGRNYRPKQVELIEIINKPLLLHLVGYLYYWQMGFNLVFKRLSTSKPLAALSIRNILLHFHRYMEHTYYTLGVKTNADGFKEPQNT